MIKYFKQLFCSHDWQDVEDSKYYMHKKCTKCDDDFWVDVSNFTGWGDSW